MWHSFHSSDVYKLEAQVCIPNGVFKNVQKNSACVVLCVPFKHCEVFSALPGHWPGQLDCHYCWSGAHGSTDRAVQPHALRTLLCYELLVHTAYFGDNSLISHLARFPWLDDSCDLWNGLEVTQLLHCRDACGQPCAERTAQECYWVPSFANQVDLKLSMWQGN